MMGHMTGETINMPFNWSTQRIAQAVTGDIIGDDVSVCGVSTDTRRIAKNELFIALTGPNFDGHDYLKSAEHANAAAVLVAKKMDTSLPQILVNDTRLALGQLARAWRKQYTLPVVGITGSNGKTTVKEIVSSILSCQQKVLATQGNLNNDIGMPLTLLQLGEEHTAAVIEMGANHAGEIEYLADISSPTVAIITNAGAAHLEGFGDLDGVAKAKGEIYSALDANGTAIINADDKYYKYWRSLCANKTVLSFGFSASADISAKQKADDCLITTPLGNISVKFNLLGEHNLMNALAATAACCAAGASLESIKTGLEKIKSVSGRLQLKTGHNGSRIIDDSYNANPASLEVALNVLTDYPGEHLLALGDMGELGSETEQLHLAAGEQARARGVNKLYAIGPYARLAAKSFGQDSKVFDDKHSLILELKDCLTADSTLLVKGSRLMQMEVVVNAIVQNGDN